MSVKNVLSKVHPRVRSTRGFTLLEFVVVIALAAAVMAGVAGFIKKGNEARVFNETQNHYRNVINGIVEMKMVRGACRSTGGNWWLLSADSSISPYFPDSYKNTGYSTTTPIIWYYLSTPGGRVYIHPNFSPSLFSTTQVATLLSKMVASGVCKPYTGASYTDGAGSWSASYYHVCELEGFSGTGGCN